jgi:DNA-binding SARP family transcriptional activator/tetratricopeptide (TPR) repeat protein
VLFRVLGTLTVGDDDQQARVPGGNARTVLAALLIRANHLVPAAELLHVAWGDADVNKTQLEKRIVEIRRLVTSVGSGTLRTVRGYGYELRLPADVLDVLQFDRHAIEADEARAAGRTEDEADLLYAALGLWQGPNVASNVDNPRLAAMTRSLEDRRRRLAVRLFEIELGRQRHDRVLPQASMLAADYPAERRLCELAMIAYHRCGEPAGANRAYVAHQRALDEQLGSKPDRLLRDLNYAIVGGDEATARAIEAALLPTATPFPAPAIVAHRPAVVPRQLPPRPADFVGRAESVAEALWLLRRAPRDAAPVLAVTGQPGAGKTTMAVHVAHEVAGSFPDGQLVADLRGSSTPANAAEVVGDFLRALGVDAVPEAGAERVRLYRTLLADRRVLIVLDDALDEEQVRDLVPGGPRNAVIVTARRRLPDIDGIHHLPTVQVLTREDATELLLAVVHRSRIELTATAPGLAQVVSLCAGLPLALRIAASQYVRDHPRPLDDLVDRLSRHGTNATDYGPRSVARSIGAGFDRLDDAARRLFLGLGLTRLVEFELWTAAAVLDDIGEPVTALTQLVDYHLVEPAGGGDRYRFHDLTRDYAHRRAGREIDAANRARILVRTYGALLGLARAAHRKIVGGDFEVVHCATPDWVPPAGVAVPADDGSAFDWFERERTNIRAGVTHCADLARNTPRPGLTDLCWDLAFTAHEFYAIRRYYDDWHATHTIALQACRDAGDLRGEALMLVGLGQPTLVASRPAGGISGPVQLERAIALLTDCGDRHGLAIAERTLANALRRRGQLAAPLELFTRALEHYQGSADLLGQWQTLRFLGQTHLHRRDISRALAYLTRAEKAAKQLGPTYAVAQTSYWKGQAHLAAGDVGAAALAFQALFDTYQASAGGTGYGYAVHAHGQLALAKGELVGAVEHLAQAAEVAVEVGDASLEGRVRTSLADAYDGLGRAAERLAELARAAGCFAGSDAVYLHATTLAALAKAWQDAGEHEAAQAARHRLQRLLEQTGLTEQDRADWGLEG